MLKDRLETYLSRAKNTLLGGLKERIIFIHVPKCAGTSIAHAIGICYPLSRKIKAVNINALASFNTVKITSEVDPFDNDYYEVLKFREQLLIYYMSLGYNYIHGHINFSERAYEEFGNSYKYITILRDPVRRWISSYIYNRYRDESPWTLQEDIIEYLNSKRGKGQGHEYVKKFYGITEKGIDFRSEESIERAKRNLDKFYLIGSIEHMEKFIKDFQRLFSTGINIPSKNKSPNPALYEEILNNDDLIEEIRRICLPDLEIYNYALQRIVR